MQKGIFSKMVAIVFMISCLLVVTQTKTYAAAGDEQLNRTSIILIVNGEKGDYSTKYGKATLRVLNSTGAPTFKSSNKKIATVGTDGVVTAYNKGKIVQMVSLDTSGFSGTGKMKMENKEVAKFTDWDGVYDNYKVVINSKSLIKVQ